MANPSTEQLVEFLKQQAEMLPDAGKLNYVKLVYRPKICPFDDLLKLVVPGAAVGDVGCGAGQFASLVAQFTQAKSIYGIEIESDLVARATALLNSYKPDLAYTFEPFDGTELPDRLGDCDIVFMIDVFHHIPKSGQLEFLRRIFDRLKPGAKFVFKDIHAGTPLVVFNKLHDLLSAGEIGHERPVFFLRNQMQEIGFQVDHVSRRRMMVYPHFTIECTKPG